MSSNEEFTELFEIDEMGVFIDSWEHHRRGKNYLAKITGEDEKYKFQREFINGKKKIDSTVYFPIKNFEDVKILEVKNIYYSGGGNPQAGEKDGYYKIRVQKDKIIGKKLSEREVILELQNKEKPNPLAKFSDDELITEIKRRKLEVN